MTPSGEGQGSTASTSRVTTPPTPSPKTLEHIQRTTSSSLLLTEGRGAEEQVEEVEKEVGVELVEEERYFDEMCVKATQTLRPFLVEDRMTAWLRTEEYQKDVQSALSVPVPQASAVGPPHHLNILVVMSLLNYLFFCKVHRTMAPYHSVLHKYM